MEKSSSALLLPPATDLNTETGKVGNNDKLAQTKTRNKIVFKSQVSKASIDGKSELSLISVPIQGIRNHSRYIDTNLS